MHPRDTTTPFAIDSASRRDKLEQCSSTSGCEELALSNDLRSWQLLNFSSLLVIDDHFPSILHDALAPQSSTYNDHPKRKSNSNTPFPALNQSITPSTVANSAVTNLKNIIRQLKKPEGDSKRSCDNSKNAENTIESPTVFNHHESLSASNPALPQATLASPKLQQLQPSSPVALQTLPQLPHREVVASSGKFDDQGSLNG
jgi:hypothetical protein